MMSQVPDKVYRARTYVMFLVFVVFVYINDRFLGHCGILYAVIAVQYEF